VVWEGEGCEAFPYPDSLVQSLGIPEARKEAAESEKKRVFGLKLTARMVHVSEMMVEFQYRPLGPNPLRRPSFG
jgi:hypothetical protein